jgi:acetyl esterase/lipase
MESELEYARHGTHGLSATHYQPPGEGPFPAVVMVHGGAWTSSNRGATADLCHALCDAGVVVFAVEFRMPPVAVYPGAADDVRTAVRWLKEHAQQLHTLPSLVGFVGVSSGGQTALLCAVDARPGEEVAFAVGCWPISDPPARYRMAKEHGLTNLIAAHEAYFGDEATMIAASPQHIVESGKARSLPPVLIVQGLADENVPSDMAPNFAAAYERAGGEIELRLFPGESHAFIKAGAGGASAEATRFIIEFIRRRSVSVA